MEQLKVIGTEDSNLVLATESGERFTLAVDDVLRAELRKARKERDNEARVPRPSPREIQKHVRAGMSAQEVAELLGARLEDVQRYEGPVLAEREHVVSQALAVPVLMGGDLEPDAKPTFGIAVRAKLTEAGASGERWTSWREDAEWIVKLEFTASDVDHDARWGFDPRKGTLSPQNADAIQLSRQGSLPEGLIPRLRALDASGFKDDTRFDSGAFGPRRPAADHDAPAEAPAPEGRAKAGAQDAAIKRAPDVPVTSSETADLLEALRRRRGQRESAPGTQQSSPDRDPSPIALFDALEPGYEETATAEDTDDTVIGERSSHEAAPDTGSRRKNRPSMPSWDEIVFGARTEEN